MESRKVLLVEDNSGDAKLALMAFEEIKFPFKVEVARDGVEALDYLFRRGAYAGREPSATALVILDLKLPRLNGMEVLAAMKQDPRLRHLPVVILTSSNAESDKAEAARRGANLYLQKPTDFLDFLEIVTRIKNLIPNASIAQ